MSTQYLLGKITSISWHITCFSIGTHLDISFPYLERISTIFGHVFFLVEKATPDRWRKKISAPEQNRPKR